jgi:hypothetical protein
MDGLHLMAQLTANNEVNGWALLGHSLVDGLAGR